MRHRVAVLRVGESVDLVRRDADNASVMSRGQRS